MATASSSSSSKAGAGKGYNKGDHFTFTRSNTEVEIVRVHEDNTVDVEEVAAPIDPVTKKELPKRWWGAVAADEKSLQPVTTK